MAFERLCLGVEIDEEEAVPACDAYRNEPVFRRIETARRLGPQRRDQPAVEIVDPAVIGAGDRAAVALSREEAGAAMPAGIGEGADRSRLVAQQDHGLADEIDGEIVPRPRDLVGAADEVPAPAEDALDLALVERVRGVAPGRQRFRLEDGTSHTLVMPGIEDGRGVDHVTISPY